MNTKYYPQINEKIMSPSEFLSEYENNPENIESSAIIPPKLGTPGFGKIAVVFKIAKELLSKNNNNHNIVKS